jgi:CO dehydrogenase/acetyl-CoA synthase epsilon subunit
MEIDKEMGDKLDAYGDDKLKMLRDDNNRYLAMYYLCTRTQHHRWLGNGQYDKTVNIGMIKRYIDKMIKIDNPQVLVEVN